MLLYEVHTLHLFPVVRITSHKVVLTVAGSACHAIHIITYCIGFKCRILVWCLTLVLSRYATTLPSDETTFFSLHLAIISINFLSSLPQHNVELSRISDNDELYQVLCNSEVEFSVHAHEQSKSYHF